MAVLIYLKRTVRPYILDHYFPYLDRKKPRRGMTVNCSERPRPRRAGMRVKTAVKSSTWREKCREV